MRDDGYHIPVTGDLSWHDEMPSGGCAHGLFGCAGVVVFLAVLIVCALLSGCATTGEPVREVHTVYDHQTDTVHTTDTVKSEKETIIREANAGDSLLLAQYGIRLRENERLLLFLQRELDVARSSQVESSHGSVARTDTVPVPYPVEKELTLWERTKVSLGGWALLAVIGYAVLRIRLRR